MAGALDPVKNAYNFLFVKKKLPTGVLGTVFLFILLVAVFSYSASSLSDKVLTMDEIQARIAGGGTAATGPDVPFPPEKYALSSPQTSTITGHSAENTEKPETASITQQNLANITFTLTWTDEPDRTILVNRPDNFGLSVTGPNGQSDTTSMMSNTHGEEGMVEITIAVNHTKADDGWGVGDWEYTVSCGDCGDYYRPRLGVLGLIGDNGNDWELTITYNYYQEK